ncbi:MAG: magnesium transporter CorA family protein [Propionibacteriaceae bacterium]
MELCWIDEGGMHPAELSELAALRARTDGFLWLDVPVWTDQAETVLRQEFGFHPMAVLGCRQRNHVPRIHGYPDHLFVVVHAPEIGTGGHVHYLELDQFIGAHFLVTVHGPLNPNVSVDVALRETRQVRARIGAGRLRPTSPLGLIYAIVSTIARNEAALVDDIARQVGLLEQRVMAATDEEPQTFLTELFTARHELLTIKTMAAQGGEIYRRALSLTTFAPPEGLDLVRDLLDQYQRVARISESQLDFLTGVTEFFRARTDTKMTVAAERLAVIAAVTLPITAISSVMGMNVIVNQSTHWVLLTILLAVMLALGLLLLRWAKRQGWW